MPYQPIENHGIIGDLGTVALVGLDGSIDFMCFPRFDSPSIFASLVDSERGGYFQIAPANDGPISRQFYLPGSNILLTRFLFDEGVAEISDFMPIAEHRQTPSVVRRAKTVRGEIEYRMVCAPRFDYGRAAHRVERVSENEVIFVSEAPDGLALRLHTEVPINIVNGAAVSEFKLESDKHVAFVLEMVEPNVPSATQNKDYVSESFKATNTFWRNWLSHCTYHGRWQEMVERSALTLKLLTSREFGSMVASPTFGLPEHRGGVRNWDYRFTWIRDASFSLYALIRLGFTGEAKSFMSWIEARCREIGPDGSLKIMYGIDGCVPLTEETLSHLEGYDRSLPVRIGNAAQGQLQLDIYGELMDSVYLHNKFCQPISNDLWMSLTKMINYVCKNWRQPDESIWEVRNGRKEFLHSRMMCWVALDRGMRLAQKRSFPAPLAEWHRVRDEIYQDIFQNFWNPERQSFMQFKGSSTVDASTLLMPLMKFIAPTDPRWLSTLRAIEKDLVQDSHVFRYLTGGVPVDGLNDNEGTFTMCSFWYAEALARAGEVKMARFIFEKTMSYANHLGLFAEELGPRGEHLGNFPQAFSHLGMISAAFCIDRALNQQDPSDGPRGL